MAAGYAIVYTLIGGGLALVVCNHSEDRGDGWATTLAASILSFALWPLIAGMLIGYAMLDLLQRDREQKQKKHIEETERRHARAPRTL